MGENGITPQEARRTSVFMQGIAYSDIDMGVKIPQERI